MTDKEKYVFRLYNIGMPTKKANEYFGQDISDRVFMGSPYVGRSDDITTLDNYKRINKEIYENESHDNKDYLNRRSMPIEGYDGHNGSLYLPHRGISVIGLSDPRFSLYEYKHMNDGIITYSADGKPTFNKQLINSLDQETQKELLDSINVYANKPLNSFNQDIGSLNKSEIQDILSAYKKAASDVLGNNVYTDDKNFNANSFDTLSNYDFGYQSNPGMSHYVDNLLGNEYVYRIGLPYEQLLRRIHETFRISGANGLVLASAPESAFYNIKDVVDGKLRAQRDYPEELLVRKLTPKKVFGTLDDYAIRNGLNEFVYNSDGLLSYDGYNKGEGHVDISNIIEELDRQSRIGRSPHDINEWAKNYINNTFEIDPNDIISDEAKKYIYNDLSAWYNNHCDKKKTEHSNILSGIKELGQ